MKPLKIPSFVQELKPYVAGKSIEETVREYGLKKVVKLASNENPLGPSKKALAAIRSALKNLALYPDPMGYRLRHALAKKEGVSFDEVVLGNGSNELMELAFHAYSVPGDRMVAGVGVFAAFPISAKIHGIDTTFVPTTADHRFDLVRMLQAVKDDDKVKWVALPNPNNPTGTYNVDDELEPFLEGVLKVRDGSVQVILDYAYWEYVSLKEMSNPVRWFKKYPNVIVLKTFSKIYGLGGLRLGYGMFHSEFAQYVQKVRLPFNVSSLALEAGQAAITDRAFVKKTLSMNKKGMKQMSQELKRLGFSFVPSQGNFLMVNVQERLGLSGVEFFNLCLKKGLIIRPVANYGLPDFIRITIGTAEENHFAVRVMQKVIDENKR
jgi:histidinol-phosphate aminotransferase